jgi:hypothetical protein
MPSNKKYNSKDCGPFRHDIVPLIEDGKETGIVCTKCGELSRHVVYIDLPKIGTDGLPEK